MEERRQIATVNDESTIESRFRFGLRARSPRRIRADPRGQLLKMEISTSGLP